MPPQMTATASTTPATTNTRKKKSSSSSSLFSFNWGCSGAKSVSVFTAHTDVPDQVPIPAAAAALSGRHTPYSLSARLETSSADSIPLTTATTSTSRDEENEEGDDSHSFSGLLRQLSQLERSVIAWSRRRQTPSGWVQLREAGEERRAHRRAHVAPGETGGGERRHRQRQRRHSGGDAVGKMGGSVVVVTVTEDPLGEFRRSMLQMIVENDIVCPEELRELLDRFLALNSPSHHALIVRAFADIWRDVFSGYLEDVPELLLTGHRRPQSQYSYYGHDYY